MQRYQWQKPGDLIHVGTEQLAYVEVLPDEQQSTTFGFLVHAVGWFSEQGMHSRRIHSDNGSP